MSVQRSQTRIINRAAALIGSTERIQQIDDGSSLAITAKALWDEALDFTLANGTYNCTVKRIRLNADTVAPLFGYAFAYTLPADCIRWLPWASSHENWFAGEEEGGKILTDAEAPLAIRYVFRNTDPSTWSAALGEAMARTLAAEMALAKSGDASLAKFFGDTAELVQRRARRIDGLSTGSRDRVSATRSRWLDARQ